MSSVVLIPPAAKACGTITNAKHYEVPLSTPTACEDAGKIIFRRIHLLLEDARSSRLAGQAQSCVTYCFVLANSRLRS